MAVKEIPFQVYLEHIYIIKVLEPVWKGIPFLLSKETKTPINIIPRYMITGGACPGAVTMNICYHYKTLAQI